MIRKMLKISVLSAGFLVFQAAAATTTRESVVIDAEPYYGCTATEQCCKFEVDPIGHDYICRSSCKDGEKIVDRSYCRNLERPGMLNILDEAASDELIEQLIAIETAPID